MAGSDADDYQSPWRADHDGVPAGDPWALPGSIPSALSDENAAVTPVDDAESAAPFDVRAIGSDRSEDARAAFARADNAPSERSSFSATPDPDADHPTAQWPFVTVPPAYTETQSTAPTSWPPHAPSTPSSWPQLSAPPAWPPIAETPPPPTPRAGVDTAGVRPSYVVTPSATFPTPPATGSAWSARPVSAAPGVYAPGPTSSSGSPWAASPWPAGPGIGPTPPPFQPSPVVRRYGLAVVIAIGLAAAVLFGVGGVLLGARLNNSGASRSPSTPAAATPGTGNGASPRPSAGVVPGIPLGAGEVLLGKIVPAPAGVTRYPIG
ncbi:MAG TPA: hypothetical protein VH442_00505, partial [Micromonosporaceae bacterium]